MNALLFVLVFVTFVSCIFAAYIKFVDCSDEHEPSLMYGLSLCWWLLNLAVVAACFIMVYGFGWSLS